MVELFSERAPDLDHFSPQMSQMDADGESESAIICDICGQLVCE
jgi:hypothetical protein